VQDIGRETAGKRDEPSERQRSRSRACYFKHDDDDAQLARQKRCGKKKKRSRRRVRLAWGSNGCHFRT